jgi:hypothetical protein
MNSADDRLRAWLRPLDAGEQAPPRVEAALLAAYRRKHARRRWKYLAPVPLAAALLWPLAFREAPPPPAAPAPQPAPASAFRRPPPPPRRPVTRVARALPRPRQEPAQAADFVPIYPGAALLPMERGQVVRVAIPRSALAPAGFPVDAVRIQERIRADVLMGEDGLVRGIRFVR